MVNLQTDQRRDCASSLPPFLALMQRALKFANDTGLHLNLFAGDVRTARPACRTRTQLRAKLDFHGGAYATCGETHTSGRDTRMCVTMKSCAAGFKRERRVETMQVTIF